MEKKTINYNGIELPCIESGYWEDGIDMLYGNDQIGMKECSSKKICLRNGVALSDDGVASLKFKYWAILPPKPAPRRLTNREFAGLCRKDWDILTTDGTVWYGNARFCKLTDENEPCSSEIDKLRAPNSDEWLEPTSDLMEVGK